MVPLTIAVELLQDHPQLLIAVAIVARLARAWQSSLTWPEYRAIHRLKRGVFPLMDRYAGGAILWVSDKGGRDDPEFGITVDGTIRETVHDLRRAGASLHLLNSLKRRPADFADGVTGDRLTDAHVVWTIGETGEQVEGYAFRNNDGTVDLYAHTEASTDNPLKHLIGAQTDGDAHGVVPSFEKKRAASDSS